MVSPSNRPLQLAPKALYRVGIDVPPDVFLPEVVNGAMVIPHLRQILIGLEGVRHDLGAAMDVILNKGQENGLIGLLDDFGLNPTLSFNRPHNGGFISQFMAALISCAVNAPYVGFVYFHNAYQWVAIRLHKPSNLLGDSPSALVGYFKMAFNLLGRYPVLGLAHQVDGIEPGCKRRRALMEDRAGHRGDLVSAGAGVRPPLFHGIKFLLAALHALKAVGIDLLEDIRQASLVIGELGLEVLEAVSCFHAKSIHDKILDVKG